MKVINELIRRFMRNGLLGENDLDQLVLGGWLTANGWIYIHPDGKRELRFPILESGWNYYDEDDYWHPYEEEGSDSEYTEKRPQKRFRVLPAANGSELEEWLATLWNCSSHRLKPLKPFLGFQNSQIPDAAGQLKVRLDGNAEEWIATWIALTENGFRDWFSKRNARGTATRAFRGLLEECDPTVQLKYYWALRYPHVAAFHETAQTQRFILKVFNHLADTDPIWINRQVRTSRDPLSLLVFNIIAGGRRIASKATDQRGSDRITSHRDLEVGMPLPPTGQRASAVLAASIMNPRQTIPFIQHLALKSQPDLLEGAKTYSDLGLRSPRNWNPFQNHK